MASRTLCFFMAFDAELAVESSFRAMFEAKARTIYHLKCCGGIELAARESDAEFAALAEMASLTWGRRLGAIGCYRLIFAALLGLGRVIGMAFHAIAHAWESS